MPRIRSAFYRPDDRTNAPVVEDKAQEDGRAQTNRKHGNVGRRSALLVEACRSDRKIAMLAPAPKALSAVMPRIRSALYRPGDRTNAPVVSEI